MIAWLQSHLIIVAPLVVATMDFAFAMVPKWESNGLLHWIYVQVKSLIK